MVTSQCLCSLLLLFFLRVDFATSADWEDEISFKSIEVTTEKADPVGPPTTMPSGATGSTTGNSATGNNYASTVTRCGRAGPQFTGRRIVGGRTAAKDEFPYQVALETRVFGGRWKQFCGGTVIADRWILTAAHCVRGQNARFLRVVGGTNDLVEGEANAVQVEKVIPHERYNSYTIQNDIALIKLAAPLSRSVNGFTNPICLPYPNSPVPVGHQGIISGFGTVSEGGRASRNLLATTIPIQPDSQCYRVYGAEYKPPSMMCAGDLRGGKDTCQGDSGGPLAVRNSEGTYVLVGVTSFGQGCARAYTPGVYTRVSNYIDWIVGKVSSN